MTRLSAILKPLNDCGAVWCRLVHHDIMWPIHGYYRCRRCQRSHLVPWEAAATQSQAGKALPFPAKFHRATAGFEAF